MIMIIMINDNDNDNYFKNFIIEYFNWNKPLPVKMKIKIKMKIKNNRNSWMLCSFNIYSINQCSLNDYWNDMMVVMMMMSGGVSNNWIINEQEAENEMDDGNQCSSHHPIEVNGDDNDDDGDGDGDDADNDDVSDLIHCLTNDIVTKNLMPLLILHKHS